MIEIIIALVILCLVVGVIIGIALAGHKHSAKIRRIQREHDRYLARDAMITREFAKRLEKRVRQQ